MVKFGRNVLLIHPFVLIYLFLLRNTIYKQFSILIIEHVPCLRNQFLCTILQTNVTNKVANHRQYHP